MQLFSVTARIPPPLTTVNKGSFQNNFAHIALWDRDIIFESYTVCAMSFVHMNCSLSEIFQSISDTYIDSLMPSRSHGNKLFLFIITDPNGHQFYYRFYHLYIN